MAGLVTDLADAGGLPARPARAPSARVAAAFAAASAAAAAGDGGDALAPTLAVLDAEYDARTPLRGDPPRRRVQLGRGLRRLLVRCRPVAARTWLGARRRCAATRRRTSPSCSALACAAGRAATRSSRRGPRRYGACAGPASAAVRLLGLDPFAVHGAAGRGWPPEVRRGAPAPRRPPATARRCRPAPRARPAGRAPRHLGGASLCVLTARPHARPRRPPRPAGRARRPGGRACPRIGIGGPVGSGKTALVAALCRALAGELTIGVVTNDIYTTEDADFLRRAGVLPDERIRAVETGGCPHTAIRDDITRQPRRGRGARGRASRRSTWSWSRAAATT